MEFDCRDNFVVIDLVCLSPIQEGSDVDFHGGPIIAYVYDLIIESRALLVLATIS